MLDFESNEKVFVDHLDPDNPERRIGAMFAGQAADGRVVVRLINGNIRCVPLSSVFKEPKLLRTP